MPIDVRQFVPPDFEPRTWQPSAPGDTWSQPPVQPSPDLTRILELPRRARIVPGSAEATLLVDFMTARLRTGRTGPCECKKLAPERECITRLLEMQAWALGEIALVQGLLGPIQVGAGKTALGLLTPLVVPLCRVALMLVPSSVLDQLVFDYRMLAQHFLVPSLRVHGRQEVFEVPSAPWLHVFTYGRLSRPKNSLFIESLRPDTIIADEADTLRHADGATTSRVLRYFAAHPETRFCAWSGSLTDSSLLDYSHLSAMSLRMNSPVPINRNVAADWARAIDPAARDQTAAPAGALEKLCEPGEEMWSGFSRRLLETQGVVSETSESVDVPLTIKAHPAPEIPTEIHDHLKTLRNLKTRPDGHQFEDALQVSACATQLACGFYYRWRYPRGEPVELIERWLEARKEWNKALRVQLKGRAPNMDSEFLCTSAAMRAWGDITGDGEVYVSEISPATGLPVQRLRRVSADGPKWKSIFWPAWRDVKDLVKPKAEAVWVNDYLAQAAADWAAEVPGRIVWYGHRAFGQRVAELGSFPLHGGGSKAGERIGRERGAVSIVASIKSHGRGRNGLQYFFHDQLIGCPPSTATAWQQLGGRTHRRGQKKHVFMRFFSHTPELAAHYEKACGRARYVQATLGSAQKLLTR